LPRALARVIGVHINDIKTSATDLAALWECGRTWSIFGNHLGNSLRNAIEDVNLYVLQLKKYLRDVRAYLDGGRDNFTQSCYETWWEGWERQGLQKVQRHRFLFRCIVFDV